MTAALLWVLGAGCLPQGAVGTHTELQADVFSFRATISATTRGAIDVPPFAWTVEGRLLSSHARAFRDGSLGRLLRWEDVHARVERSGAPAVETAAGLDGAWMELRAFPRGTVLKVEPLAPWTGTAGHAELLDALWTAVTPDIPALRVGQHAEHATSWPVWAHGAPQPFLRFTPTWTLQARERAEGTWTYEGPLAADVPRVRIAGTARGRVRLDVDAPRVLEHAFTQDRTQTTVWGPRVEVVQELHLDGAVTWTGTAPAPVSADVLVQDDPVAEAAPLRLPDGRVLARDARVAPEALPFLLLPDDWSAAQRAEVSAALAPPGSIAP